MQEYSIGGQEKKSNDAAEGIADIPLNRTLFIEKLTADAPVKPELFKTVVQNGEVKVKGPRTVEDVFENYKPSIEVEFTDEEGVGKEEKLNFKNLGDFGVKGITKQSPFLQNLTRQESDYQKIIKQLSSNKILKKILADPEAKASYLGVLKTLIEELEASEA